MGRLPVAVADSNVCGLMHPGSNFSIVQDTLAGAPPPLSVVQYQVIDHVPAAILLAVSTLFQETPPEGLRFLEVGELPWVSLKD